MCLPCMAQARCEHMTHCIHLVHSNSLCTVLQLHSYIKNTFDTNNASTITMLANDKPDYILPQAPVLLNSGDQNKHHFEHIL